jgi:hypothetical protein
VPLSFLSDFRHSESSSGGNMRLGLAELDNPIEMVGSPFCRFLTEKLVYDSKVSHRVVILAFGKRRKSLKYKATD